MQIDNTTHARLDAELLVLLGLLSSRPRAAHSTVAAQVEAILAGLEDKLLRPNWADTWKTAACVTTGWFGDLPRDPVAHALYAAVTALVRLVLDGSTRHRQETYAGQLEETLRGYLSLRGLPEPPTRAEASACIVALDLTRRMYRPGTAEPVIVTDGEDEVLQTFLLAPCMDHEQLVNASGRDNAAKILKNLTTKYGDSFAPYIVLPTKKGKGGYRVHIRKPDSGPN